MNDAWYKSECGQPCGFGGEKFKWLVRMVLLHPFNPPSNPIPLPLLSSAAVTTPIRSTFRLPTSNFNTSNRALTALHTFILYLTPIPVLTIQIYISELLILNALRSNIFTIIRSSHYGIFKRYFLSTLF